MIDCSFIVTMYNREETIDRCLDALVFQRTKRTFEIIVVDDGSTDASRMKVERWRDGHSGLIRLFLNPGKGVADAKNFGVKEARGRFVAFVDSDDYVDYRYIETMIGSDGVLSADLVVAPVWSVKNGRPERLEILSEPCASSDKANLLSASYYFFHGKFIRKRLFDAFGPIPRLGISEDTSWMFPALAKAKNVVYVDWPGYFYELSKNSLSATVCPRDLVDSALVSSRLILEGTPERFRSEAMKYVMRRMLTYYLPKAAGCSGKFKAFLRDRPELCAEWERSAEEEAPEACRAFRRLMGDAPADFPAMVFLDGFSGHPRVKSAETVFGDETAVDVLNPSTCRVEEAPESVRAAFAREDFGFVAGYFALRRIYEKGGVFLGSSMTVVNPFGRMRQAQAFFAYETQRSFSAKVFGGAAGQEVFRLLLKTYSSPAIEPCMPLASRIRLVVTGLTNLLNYAGAVERTAYGITLCPVSVFVFSEGEKRVRALSIDEECKRPSERAFDLETADERWNADGSAVLAPTSSLLQKYQAEIRQYRQQITAMETSVVWRLKERLKRPFVRMGIFHPLKRCGIGILNLFR